MSWVNVAVGVTSAYTQAQAGGTARMLANAQAGQLDYQAKVERDAGLKTAEIIRRAGRRQVGAGNAAYAAAGVQVGAGSAAEVERQTMIDVEHDAYQSILQGERRAIGLEADAKISRISGRAQEHAGYVRAASTLLQTGYGAYTKWQTKPDPYDESGIRNSRTGADIRGRR
jgi:hypothetical protein